MAKKPIKKKVKTIASINGFTIQLKTDEEGGLEFPVFSSVRKTPELLGLIKKINLLLAKQATNGVRHHNSTIKMLEAEGADLEKVEKEYVKLIDSNDELLIKIQNAFYNFALRGFTGAGYPKAEAERLTSFLSIEDFGLIKEISLRGGSKLDLSKA